MPYKISELLILVNSENRQLPGVSVLIHMLLGVVQQPPADLSSGYSSKRLWLYAPHTFAMMLPEMP